MLLVHGLDEVEHGGEGGALPRPAVAMEDPHLAGRRRRGVVRGRGVVLELLRRKKKLVRFKRELFLKILPRYARSHVH